MSEIEYFDRPLNVNIDRLAKEFEDKTSVLGVQHRLSEMFILMFIEQFGDFPFSTGNNINKSNWTHHVYYCIRSSAKIMSVACNFEVNGRLDATIETINSEPGVFIVAEWESECESVFGEKGEIEKLIKACEKNKNADAMLFTYCDSSKYISFIKKVVEIWQKANTEKSLYLIIIVYEADKKFNEFKFLRVHEIKSKQVLLWHDIGFVDVDEYLECIHKI